jgi:hypothetical protein
MNTAMYILVIGRTVRISNRNLDIRFSPKFELGMKKNQTGLSIIFYCSKIELENICRTRLTGHDSSKTKYLYNSSKLIFEK